MAAISRVANLGINVALQNGEASVSQIRRIGDEGESAGRRARSGIESINPALERMAKLAAEAFAVRKVIEYADAMTRLRGQLSIVVQGTEQLVRVQNALFDVAQRTRQEYEAVGELYARIVRSTRELGLSQKQLVDTTEAVSRAVLISNVSTQTAQAGMYQLSQAFAAGRLQGQDFKAVIEDIPRLGQAIAEGLGVSVGKLREMSQQGEITSAKIVEALQKSNATLVAESAKLAPTVGQSFVVLENSLKRFIDQQNQAFGITSGLATAIQSLAKNLDALAKVGEVVAAVFAARWLASFAAANAATVELYTQTARGNAVMLDGVTATRARAAAAVEEATATLAGVQAKRAEIVAEQEAIAARRASASASIAATQANLGRRVDPSALTPLGGAAVNREIAIQNALRREQAIAFRAGASAAAEAAVAEQRLLGVDLELATANEAVAATETAKAAAFARTAATSRAAAASTGAFSTAMAALGGPIGVALLAAVGINEALNAYERHVEKSVELTDAQTAAYEAALAKERARNTAIKQATDEETRRQQAYAATIAQRQEELNKLRVLNDAYGTSDAALKSIEVRYDALVEKAKNSVGHTKEQTAALNALTDALAAQKIRAIELADAHQKIDEMNERLTAGFGRLEPQITLVNKAYDRTVASLKILNEQVSDINKIGARNKTATDAEDKARKDRLEKEQRYQDDLAGIWRSGVSKIATDGLKSFQDFFEDVNQLFIKLLERMQREGKADGTAGKLLGLGVSAIGGYSIGNASGSAVTGALGGAAAGFATAGPLGALVGGLAGLTGGLIGGAKAAEERRKAEEQLTRSYNQSIAQIKNQLGDLSDIDYAKSQLQTQADALRAQALELYGKDSNLVKYFGKDKDRLPDALKQIDDLTKRRIKQLEDEAAAMRAAAVEAERLRNAQAQDSYRLRILNASGDSDAVFALQQTLERSAAVADKLDDLTLAYLDSAQAAERAQREREKQTQLLQGQLATAQQTLEQNKAVVDSLTSFKNGLALSQYSPLSPRQQLDAARGQLNTLYQSALGGDVNAGNQFGSVASQFLDASRRYNASGAGYVLDFNSVNVMTDALQKAFGNRVSDAQQQVNLLQAQLDKLTGVQQSIIDLGTTLITVNTNLGQLQQSIAKSNDERLEEIDATITETSREIVRGLEAIRSVASK